MPTVIDRARLRGGPLNLSLTRLLREAVAELSAAEGTIWILSTDRDRLDAVLNIGPARGVVEAMSVPIDQSVVGLVVSTGIASCIGPDDWHNPDLDQATGISTLAMAAAPLRWQDDVIGVVSAINPLAARERFSGQDLDTLQWKAYLMGLVLDTAVASA